MVESTQVSYDDPAYAKFKKAGVLKGAEMVKYNFKTYSIDREKLGHDSHPSHQGSFTLDT
jgi:hypothetical protein